MGHLDIQPRFNQCSSFNLGPFKVEHPFILAPMAGITNSAFRRLMRRMNSPIVISELVSANGLEYNSQRTKDLLAFQKDEHLIGLQIFGERPELLVKACQYVESLGADFVDLNLGCPVKKVVRDGAGCAMTRDLSLLSQVLEKMVRAVKIPVTIKIRTGWNEQNKNAHEVVQVAYEAGVSWVAIHGRTRAQAYEGLADWNYIGEVKSKAKLPIIGNGDITTPEKAVEAYQKSGVDAILIGRGALRNPFLFQQCRNLLLTGTYDKPNEEDYLRLIFSQREIIQDSLTPRRALLHAKKFLSWYSAGFRNSSEFRRHLFSLQSVDEVWSEAEKFFTANALARNLDFLAEPFLMGGHG